MEKLKILGVSSEDYPKGRIDSFRIPLVRGINHEKIIPLFVDFGLSDEKATDELDIDFENKGIYPAGTSFFIYVSPKLKAYLIIEDKTISLQFDTSLPREEIVNVVEKHFQFPE